MMIVRVYCGKDVSGIRLYKSRRPGVDTRAKSFVVGRGHRRICSRTYGVKVASKHVVKTGKTTLLEGAPGATCSSRSRLRRYGICATGH